MPHACTNIGPDMPKRCDINGADHARASYLFISRIPQITPSRFCAEAIEIRRVEKTDSKFSTKTNSSVLKIEL